MLTRNVRGLVLAGLIAATATACIGNAIDENSIEQDVTSPPTNVVATATTSSNISVMWTGVTNSTKYYVFRGPSSGTETYLTSVTTTSFGDGHLNAGTQYCYFIEAVVNNVASGPSNESCATTIGAPAAPTGVTATPVSTTRISVTWNSVAGAIKYYVYDSLNGGTYTYINTTTTNSYIAANLQAGGNYCFEVQVVTSNGTSAMSAPGCSGTFTGGLEGYWKFNEKSGAVAMDSSGLGRNGTLTGNVTYSTTDRPPVADDFSTLSFGGGAGDYVSVPDAPALNASGPYTVSAWVKITSAGSGTINLIGKRGASCGATTWQIAQDSTGLHLDNATTKVSWGQSLPVGTWTQFAFSATGGNGNQVRFYINGALVGSGAWAPSTASTAALQLGNSGGCGSSGGTFLMDEVRVYSAALTDAQIADLGTVPPPPSGLTGSSPGQTSVNLSWNAITNPQKYFVFRGTASGAETFLATVIAPTTTYTDTHLTANTTYYYYISDQAHGLLSGPSSEISVTTQPPPPAPTGVTATAISSTQINVAWNAVTGTTKYYVYQSTNGGAYAFRNTVFAPTVTFSATGLTTATPYCYEIVAETSPNIDSAPSSPACATTP